MRSIRRAYLALGYLDTTPLAQEWLTGAARFEALAAMTLEQIGTVAGANRKSACALQAAAHRLLDRLEANGFRTRTGAGPTTASDRIRVLSRESAS